MREDRIISALIGLAGACNNNPKTAGTDCLMMEALAFPLLYPGYDDRALQKMVDAIHAEKNAVAPGCAMCASPCGNTSDFDMRRLDEAEEGVRQIKLRILAKIQRLAASAFRRQTADNSPDMEVELFYEALAYVSYVMDEADLLRLLDKIEKTEHDTRLGGTQDDTEDHQH